MSEQLHDPSALLDEAIHHLDEATRSLSLIERDPATAIDDAYEALDVARAALRLLGSDGKSERPVLSDAARRLRPLHALYVSPTTHRSSPPPLAPSVRQTASQITTTILGARIRVADRRETFLAVTEVEAELDRTYRRARRRWRRLLADPTSTSRGRAQRAIRRMAHQLELIGLDDDRVFAFVELGFRLDQPAEFDEIDGAVELGCALFAVTPKRHERWIRAELGHSASSNGRVGR